MGRRTFFAAIPSPRSNGRILKDMLTRASVLFKKRGGRAYITIAIFIGNYFTNLREGV
jgi:hypothetical protein